MPREESRRVFLRQLVGGRPRGFSGEGGHVPQEDSLPSRRSSGDSNPAGGPYKLTVGRRAMAAEFQVILNLGQYSHGVEAALAALDMLEPLEDMMSFFRPNGELGRINALASRGEVPVSEELWSLLVECHKLWEETQGAFDITAAPLWQVWGFARREGRLPSEKEISQSRELCGWRHVILDHSRRTLRFTRPGVALNLGSIGKGYALDRLAAILSDLGVKDFLLHGGLSSVKAAGHSWEEMTRDDGVPPRGWPIGISNPLRPGKRLGQIWLKNSAVGTSGTSLQFFWHKGKRYGHILDPRTGYPVEGVLSVTVSAPTAAEADALATAFFVLGPDSAASVCENRPNVSAVFLLPEEGGLPQVQSIGAPLDIEWLADQN